MQRSVGVTVSAVFVFLGSILTLLFGGFMAFATLVMPHQSPQPPFIRAMLAVLTVVYFAFAIWGIVSGVGLLLLRNWARISMLIFGGILLLFTIPGILMVPFLPAPQTPGSPDELFLTIKIFTALFYAVFAAVGGAWAYFFSRRSVTEQFLGLEEMARRAANPSRRPTSITVIGWILLATGILVAPFTLFWHFPTMFMGFVLTGWTASLFLLAWCVVQGLAGAGLLRLRPWGRTLAIGMFSFGLLNCAAMVLVPGALARLLQTNEAMQASVRSRMGLPTTDIAAVYSPERMHSFLWAGLVFGLLLWGVQMWFVVSRKDAFSDPTEAAALTP